MFHSLGVVYLIKNRMMLPKDCCWLSPWILYHVHQSLQKGGEYYRAAPTGFSRFICSTSEVSQQAEEEMFFVQ